MPAVLVIGAPKSGSHAAAAHLRAAGVRVLHEGHGRDGSVSAWLSVADWWHPAAVRNDLRSDYPDARTIHLVRHPLAAIASLLAFEHPQFWQWQERHTSLPYARTPEFMAHFWVRWQQLCRTQSRRAWRIEHTAAQWPLISSWVVTEAPFVELAHDPRWETHNKKPVAWSDLGNMQPLVRQMARTLGYEESA